MNPYYNAYKRITAHDPIWRPYRHEQVIANGRKEDGTRVEVCIVGACYSEYTSGPNLCDLADTVGQIFGPGYYGLKQSVFTGRID